MPELPEVETIRRNLAPHTEGRTLQRLEILDPRWSRPLAPRELADAVEGRRVDRLGRRGKYLIWELEDEAYLLVHLRMTGNLLIDPSSPLTTASGSSSAITGWRSRTRAASAPASWRWGRTGWRRSWRGGSGSSRSTAGSPPSTSTGSRARRGRRSRRSCSIRSGSRASGTSTRTRRSSARASTRCGPRTGSRGRSARRCAMRSSRRWRRGSRPRAPRSTTSATPTASAGPSRTSS